MTISIWRYSHLTLAISSFAFIFLAAVTGIILAFEPISNQLKPYANHDLEKVTLAETITSLHRNYDVVVSIEKDNNNFISASVITKEGNNETFYINPKTGEKTGDIIEKSPLFKFATSLHRSLFLKSTGRFIVGLVSFLLFLVALSGTILIVKRQSGVKQFFSKIVKENFSQYYHIVFGRLTLIPILLITLTGVYLSLEKFSLLPEHSISHQIDFDSLKTTPQLQPKEFNLFKSIELNNLKKMEYPFSEDVEDYFLIELKDKELAVNQYTGEVLSEIAHPFTELASQWSFVWHTGQGSTFWSIVLLLSCMGILFFIYSGFDITLKRQKHKERLKNPHKKDECEYIILIGSETGSTTAFAKLFYKALQAIGKKVFITELNKFSSYKNAKHLIVFTSTYGQGEAPVNARKFKQLFKTFNPDQNIDYTVLGFGSMAYPDYCKYAIEVDALLKAHPKCNPILKLHKINNQSFEAFKSWVIEWSKASESDPLHIKQPKKNTKLKKQKHFKVISRTELNEQQTFMVMLKPEQKSRFNSGDLLAISPKEDNVERLYSIGKVGDSIVLSVKKHEFGVCSSYLSQLQQQDSFRASIKRNPGFHFPKKAKSVIMIANGTGIAPFLGMINDNKKGIKTHLFFGERNKSSIQLYSSLLEKGVVEKRLSSLNIAYSQEQRKKVYVQDLIAKETQLVVQTLTDSGSILICGSVAMQKEVLQILDMITRTNLNKSLSEFIHKKQLKMDCY